MAEPLFQLKPTDDARRWRLEVTEDLCVGPDNHRFMFGGVGLAAAITSLEKSCGRPVIWATAQYLSYARPGSVVEYDVRTPTVGKHLTQARVVAHVGGEEIIAVLASLGDRPAELADQWVQAPPAPPPLDCEPAPHWRGRAVDLKAKFEVRRVSGRYQSSSVFEGRGDGHVVIWVRALGQDRIGTDGLAVIGDFLSSAVADAIGVRAGGNSLDNAIRYAHVVATEWVLAELQIEAVRAGMVHGTVRLFAETGELMASASQSMILRVF
jgi:acyl-CoA thioesterase-2